MTSPVVTSPVVQAVGDAITAALVGPLADWQVLDSIDPQQAYAPKSLMVGGRWDPDAGEDGGLTADETVLVETTEVGAGRRLVETTQIECLAYSGSGEVGFAAHRQAVNDALTAVRGALRDLHSVDGASARAQMSSQQWASVLDDGGHGVMAMFTITVTVLP